MQPTFVMMMLTLASAATDTCSLCPVTEPETDYTGFIVALVISGGIVFTAFFLSAWAGLSPAITVGPAPKRPVIAAK